jgi:DNA adenine methylase
MDSGLVGFFRVLRDPDQWERLRELCALTPYSREEYEYCRENRQTATSDPVEQAYRWFVVCRMSFSGIFANSWGLGVESSNRGMASCCSKWMSGIDRLAEVHERILRVQIEHDDFRKIIERYDTSRTVFYLDPPYIPETRKAGYYAHELTPDDHRELVKILLAIEGKALLSGYAHPIYEPLVQAGWERKDFDVVCSAAGRTRNSGLKGAGHVKEEQKRVESVWVSPRSIESFGGLYGDETAGP